MTSKPDDSSERESEDLNETPKSSGSSLESFFTSFLTASPPFPNVAFRNDLWTSNRTDEYEFLTIWLDLPVALPTGSASAATNIERIAMTTTSSTRVNQDVDRNLARMFWIRNCSGN